MVASGTGAGEGYDGTAVLLLVAVSLILYRLQQQVGLTAVTLLAARDVRDYIQQYRVSPTQ